MVSEYSTGDDERTFRSAPAPCSARPTRSRAARARRHGRGLPASHLRLPGQAGRDQGAARRDGRRATRRSRGSSARRRSPRARPPQHRRGARLQRAADGHAVPRARVSRRARSLAQRLARGRAAARARRWRSRGRSARRCAAAHRAGIVHRDLKPRNIFLVPTEIGGDARRVVKVLDFGISKIRGSQTVQTQDAALLGTPQYMAPEQATGKNTEVDARTDVFALGAIVYEMLSGQPAFTGDDAGRGRVQGRVRSSRRSAQLAPALPKNVVDAVEQALAKDINARFADVAAFINALTGRPLQTLDRAKREESGAGGVCVDAGGGGAVASGGCRRRRRGRAARWRRRRFRRRRGPERRSRAGRRSGRSSRRALIAAIGGTVGVMKLTRPKRRRTCRRRWRGDAAAEGGDAAAESGSDARRWRAPATGTTTKRREPPSRRWSCTSAKVPPARGQEGDAAAGGGSRARRRREVDRLASRREAIRQARHTLSTTQVEPRVLHHRARLLQAGRSRQRQGGAALGRRRRSRARPQVLQGGGHGPAVRASRAPGAPAGRRAARRPCVTTSRRRRRRARRSATRIDELVARIAQEERRAEPRPDARLDAAATEIVHVAPGDGAPPNELVQGALWVHGIVEPPPQLILTAMGPAATTSCCAQLARDLPKVLSQGRYARVGVGLVPVAAARRACSSRCRSRSSISSRSRARSRPAATGRCAGACTKVRAARGVRHHARWHGVKPRARRRRSRALRRHVPLRAAKGALSGRSHRRRSLRRTVVANFPVWCGVAAPTTAAGGVAGRRRQGRRVHHDGGRGADDLEAAQRRSHARRLAGARRGTRSWRRWRARHSADMQAHGLLRPCVADDGSAADRRARRASTPCSSSRTWRAPSRRARPSAAS